MNLDSFNKWISVVANIGVLVGIFVVVIELQQTQDSLAATGHSSRTDRNMAIAEFSTEHGIGEITSKQLRGESLTEQDVYTLANFYRMLLRHFEDLHYQYQLGIIDDETWEANLTGISNMVNRPGFEELIGIETSGTRKSFRDLMLSLKE